MYYITIDYENQHVKFRSRDGHILRDYYRLSADSSLSMHKVCDLANRHSFTKEMIDQIFRAMQLF